MVTLAMSWQHNTKSQTFATALQDQITVLTQMLSTLTGFVTSYISNTTACILHDPLCSTCTDATTCRSCQEVRHITRPRLVPIRHFPLPGTRLILDTLSTLQPAVFPASKSPVSLLFPAFLSRNSGGRPDQKGALCR